MANTRKFDLDRFTDHLPDKAAQALAGIHYRACRAVDRNGLKIGAVDFDEVWAEMEAAYGPNTTRQEIRRRLLRWRGEARGKHGCLADPPPANAWIERAEEGDAPTTQYYRVTDHALRLLGLHRAIDVRNRQFPWAHANLRRGAAKRAKRKDSRIPIKALRTLHRYHPDGFDLDTLHAALKGAGSRIGRDRARTFAWRFAEEGWLIKVGRGRFKVDAEHHEIARREDPPGPQVTYRQKHAPKKPHAA